VYDKNHETEKMNRIMIHIYQGFYSMV